MRKLYTFSKSLVSYFALPLGMPEAKREPTPCYRDAYSVDVLKWASWEKGCQMHL